MIEHVVGAIGKKGEVSILVAAKYVESFYNYLKTIHVDCSLPQPAIFHREGHHQRI